VKRKRHSPAEIIAKLRNAGADPNQGATIETVSQKLEVSHPTFHHSQDLEGKGRALT